MTLNLDEQTYYNRQITLNGFGIEAQEKLKNASVLCIGAGGLGSPILMYLAGAGIGKLGLIDFDVIDHTNLHRQVIHTFDNIGVSKTESAKQFIEKLNPNISSIVFDEMLTVDNIEDIFSKFDIIVDGTDNFNTRYLINDACVLLKKTLVFGSVFRFEGQVSIFATPEGPCYRCIYPTPPDPESVSTCAEDGIIGVIPGVIGTIQASETIKLITGIGENLIGNLLRFDFRKMNFETFKIKKNQDCPICGSHPEITSLLNNEVYCEFDSDIEITSLELLEFGNKSEIKIIDIRSDLERKNSFIENLKYMSIDKLKQEIHTIDRRIPIILVCQSGHRSYSLAKNLKNNFPNIYSLQNGIKSLHHKIESRF